MHIIIAFVIGIMFAAPISWIGARMFYRSGGPEMCEKKCKIVIDSKLELKAEREDKNNKLSSILNKVNEL